MSASASRPHHRRPSWGWRLLVLHIWAASPVPGMASNTVDLRFESIASRAEALVKVPDRSLDSEQVPLPQALRALSYDQVRRIRFRPDKSVWHKEDLPFELMFFHRSGRSPDMVRVHEFTAGGEHDISYDAADFDFAGQATSNWVAWGDIGYAGWRAHYALNRADYKDEVVAFLGASYFRALGQHQRYGLSARGLAINPLGPGREEFPRFTAYWFVRPESHAAKLTFYALLESPKIVGAYRFEVRPGLSTEMDVRARLFARAKVDTLGIAPLTSMFLFGENQPGRGDFRPEVHDSDGLLVAMDGPDGEWIWRPLINPDRTLTTSYEVSHLKGFGLIQRDRLFTSYEDTEARYELRPSVWVEPMGSWGPGRVTLLQLHAEDETADNVTAYWTFSRTQLAPGQALDVAYRLHWQGPLDQKPPQGWVTQSRLGHGWHALPPDQVQYVVDFSGPSLAGLSPDAPVHAVVTSSSSGDVLFSNVFFNEATHTWRMTVTARWKTPSAPLELRGFLKLAQQTLTETWNPILAPTKPP